MVLLLVMFHRVCPRLKMLEFICLPPVTLYLSLKTKNIQILALVVRPNTGGPHLRGGPHHKGGPHLRGETLPKVHHALVLPSSERRFTQILLLSPHPTWLQRQVKEIQSGTYP